MECLLFVPFFFFNDAATTEIYTLSLHDALPISGPGCSAGNVEVTTNTDAALRADRKSTRLNSSHANISYAVFCLKKKTSTRPSPRWMLYTTCYAGEAMKA